MIPILVCFFFSLTAHAEEACDIQREIQDIQKTLDTVRTFQAPFEQTNPDGTVFKGTFYLKRPGFLKIHYDTPQGMTIVADGTHLVYKDAKSPRPTYLPLESSPANLLLDETLDFQVHAALVSIEKKGKNRLLIRLKTHQTKQRITFDYDAGEKMIKGWTTIDPQGHTVIIRFLAPYALNTPLSQDLFTLPRPKRSKGCA